MYSPKKHLSITILSLASCVPVLGMQQEQSLIQAPQEVQEICHNNTNLHINVEQYIEKQFPQAQTLEELINALTQQSQTDQTLEQLLQNPDFTNDIITYLGARFNKHYLECALLLNTPESTAWYSKSLKAQLSSLATDDSTHNAASDSQNLIETLKICIATHSNTVIQRLLPLVASEHHLELLKTAVRHDNSQAITIILRQARTVLDQSDDPLLLYAQNQLIDKLTTSNRAQVKALLEGGLNPNFFDAFRITPLQRVAMAHDIDLTRLLIEYGADVNQANQLDQTPLALALRSRNSPLALIELLVRAGAHTESINQALVKAVELNRPDLVQLLMRQPSININYSDPHSLIRTNPLIVAARNNHEAIAQLLLRHPQINVNARQHETSAIEHALNNNNRALIHALLNKKANTADWLSMHQRNLLQEIQQERTHMNQVAEKGNIQAIHKLRGQNIPLTPQAIKVLQALYTKFFNALDTNNIEWIKWAIKCGLSVNVHGTDGNTPLHKAVIRHSQLISSGFGGNTTLYQTAVQISEEIIKLLLLVGADPTLTNNNGQTPLHLAAEKPHLLNLFLSFAYRDIPNTSNSAIQWPESANVAGLLESKTSRSKDTCTIS